MTNRNIPQWTDNSAEGVRKWFKDMCDQGLLFHPDDSPEDVIDGRTGQRLFSDDEAVYLSRLLADMFSAHGNRVYEEGLAVMHEALGIKPE